MGQNRAADPRRVPLRVADPFIRREAVSTVGERGPLKLPPLRVVADGEVVVDGDPGPTTAHTAIRPQRPVKPAGLPKAAEPMWDEIVDALDAAGLIARCDAATLELALRHYLAAVRASNALMRSAVTQEDKKNQRVMKNPASQVFRDHSTAFLEFAKQLGLTFVSRARVPLGDKEAGGGAHNPFA